MVTRNKPDTLNKGMVAPQFTKLYICYFISANLLNRILFLFFVVVFFFVLFFVFVFFLGGRGAGFFAEFPANCPCVFCLHLPELILSVDYDWLISIKVFQSLE